MQGRWPGPYKFKRMKSYYQQAGLPYMCLHPGPINTKPRTMSFCKLIWNLYKAETHTRLPDQQEKFPLAHTP